MVIYLKPIAAKFEENHSIGIGCIERTRQWRWTDGRTDRPSDGRTRQSKSIIAPHMIKMCVGDMKWTRSVTDGKTDGLCR